MRADRLVAVLLLLQRRGRVTAAEVAAELEVSERTARRDLEALAMSGVPVYPSQGRGGGWRLVGGARTDLSGLRADEARALFLVAGPHAATAEVKTALRKLVRALPEPLRDQAEAASRALVVDPNGWDGARRSRPTPEHLDAVQAAVVDGVQVRLRYVARDGTPSERTVHPLGLVAKGAHWYLMAGTDAGPRTFRVDRVTAVDRTGEPAVRPDGFSLADEWARTIDRVDHLRSPLVARASADVEVLGHLRHTFGSRVAIGGTQPDGRVAVELRAQNARGLVAALAGFGGHVEVHEPAEVVDELVEVAREVLARYGR